MQSDLETHARARVGAVIHKKYRLGNVIGLGGMATVYQAEHRNGHRVAIKMLHSHLSIDADIRSRFLREGYVANKVDHPGAVRVLDDDTAEDGSVFLVMELLEGETLDARCRRSGGRLPARDVCGLANQLLDVLGAAHAKGIVHRDIKPENLFLTGEGVLKVLDFGIARLRETTGLEGATKTGRMIGTPAFMPPEQVLGKAREIDGQTDIYAVGATMFTLVSGQFVHPAETMEEMLVRAGSRPARSVLTVLPELARGVAGVIDRALVFEKQGRWPDVRTMARALGEAYRAVYGAQLPAARASRLPLEAPALSLPEVADKNAPTRDDSWLAGESAQAMAFKPSANSSTQPASSWPPSHPAAKAVSTSAGLSGTAATDRRAGQWGAGRGATLWVAVGSSTAIALGVTFYFLATSSSHSTRDAAPVPPTSASAPTAGLARPPASVADVPACAVQPQLVAFSALPIERAAPDAQTEKPDHGVPRAKATAPYVARPTPSAALPAPPPSSTLVQMQAMPLAPTATAQPPACSPKPNCDVPFYVDNHGIQRIRPECR